MNAFVGNGRRADLWREMQGELRWNEGRDAQCLFPKRTQIRASTSNTTEIVDPITEARLGEAPIGQSEDVEQALVAAKMFRTTNPGWTSGEMAIRTLSSLIDEIEKARDTFGKAIMLDIGAPKSLAFGHHVSQAISHLKGYRSAVTQAHQVEEVCGNDHYVSYQPIGIAALITPWNWPLVQIALKVGAGIASGCAVVLKPSEQATLTALVFAQCLEKAKLPRGQVNIVLGDSSTGAALVDAESVDIVSFTGSSEIGRVVASRAAANLTPSVLELGGKSANIIFDDVDLGTRVAQGVAHCFRNAGQSCNAASRMLVQTNSYADAVSIAKGAAQSYCPLGSGSGSQSEIGPLVSQVQFDRVQELLATALRQGATLVTGGIGRPEEVTEGFFVKPTVLADVLPHMEIFQKEVFGPVLCLTPFSSEEDAIRIANATDYGLAGYVQTSDPDQASRVAQALRCGVVQINGTSRETGAPFGGIKASGFGREGGLWGIRAFQTVKSVSSGGFGPTQPVVTSEV